MSGERNQPRNAVEREIFVRSMAFGRAPNRDNRLLGDAMHEASFKAGSVLYRAGDPPDDIYFIVKGIVEVRKPGAPPRRFDERSVVGILDATQDRPHDRDAVAITDVETLVLRNEDRMELMEDGFEYTRDVILFTSAMLQELTLGLEDFGLSEPPDGTLDGAPANDEPLPLIERVLTLRDVRAFERASIQPLISLAPLAREVRVPAGATLFEAGEVRSVFYIVARGLIELQRASPAGSARFGPSALVGGVPAIGDGERLYSARALQDSVLLCIRESDFFEVMEDHFELARSVLAFIAAERVRVVDLLEQRAAAAQDGQGQAPT